MRCLWNRIQLTGTECRSQLGAQHLHGHLATVLQVIREIHGGHATCAELALDGVSFRNGRAETLEGAGHRAKLRGVAARVQTVSRIRAMHFLKHEIDGRLSKNFQLAQLGSGLPDHPKPLHRLLGGRFRGTCILQTPPFDQRADASTE